MYIQNWRNSSKINGYNPFQNFNGLIDLKPAILNISYMQRLTLFAKKTNSTNII